MKTWIRLILCLLWSCSSTSQDLKPIVQTFKNTEYLCFDTEQSQYLAKTLEYSIFQDSIIDALKQKSDQWTQLLQKKDTTISKLKAKHKNLLSIQSNDQAQIQVLHYTIKQQQKKIRSGKFERWFMGGGLLILTGLLIGH